MARHKNVASLTWALADFVETPLNRRLHYML
jgi:hypothetical protein